ncbi:alpha/beta hydrolase [Candidatus Cyanaurora vandensis]|uniref:alpha/beta hydrolase n=1 Tax=Candidatus Cyanaurora vandensis TaxID=2714958 RepID=UPI00257C4E9B|nr:alpha/beta fold hydrolase [Candidatus Cyanaurora vandensis]
MEALTWTEYNPAPDPSYLLIALHGMGTHGGDLEPLAEALDLPGVRYIFPTAPFFMATWAYQWYDLSKPDLDIPESAERLVHLIQHLQSLYGPLPFILLGFSQGAVMALEVGLTFLPRPLALVALSGYLNRLPDLPPPPHPPLFVGHGVQDGIVSVRFGRNLQQVLQEAGLVLDYQEFPVGHTISLEMVQAVRQFLLPILAR